MVLFLLAYAGGVLTIVSPCILPVLPFIFARADRPFLWNGLPMLAGMAAAFAAVATLAAFGGGWAVRINQYGRDAALGLMALFGLTLLLPGLASRMARPLVALGEQLSRSVEPRGKVSAPGFLSSALLGGATGLLWAPCAGPILGLILTGAALQGASAQTSLLLLAYAAGAATSLALALFAGAQAFAALKRSLGAGEWIRRGLGLAVLGSAAAIALGLDTGFLTRVSLAGTSMLEQGLLDRFQSAAGPTIMTSHSATMMTAARRTPAEALPVEGRLPALSGAVEWLNSPPLKAESLRGKVVLVDFWTYSCINCLRAIPYVRAWAGKYKDQGLVVIGVHAPEFAFEKNVSNVRAAVASLGIAYPVAIDNTYAIWRAFDNHYWPAHYFIDAEGRIRHHHFGEGDYDGSEQVIQELLADAGKTSVPGGLVSVSARGAEAAPDMSEVRSPETYIGYERAENFISPGGAVPDTPHLYEASAPRLNEWSLSGVWTIKDEHAALEGKDGSIVFRFHARDLHLVLGPSPDGKPVRFKVTIDDAAPGSSHGTDIDAEGRGSVTSQRLYQLVRQSGPVIDHTFAIQFLDPGVQAFAFTFG